MKGNPLAIFLIMASVGILTLGCLFGDTRASNIEDTFVVKSVEMDGDLFRYELEQGYTPYYLTTDKVHSVGDTIRIK